MTQDWFLLFSRSYFTVIFLYLVQVRSNLKKIVGLVGFLANHGRDNGMVVVRMFVTDV